MTAFNFPNSPAVDDTYTHNGVTYRWTGVRWTNVDPGNLVFSGTAQTISNKKLVNYSDEVYEIIDGASVELDPSNGHVQIWTLTANRAPSATNFAEGQMMLLHISDGTAYTIDWAENMSVTWVGGTAVELHPADQTVVLLWKVLGILYARACGTVAAVPAPEPEPAPSPEPEPD